MNVSRLLLGVFGLAVAGTFYVAASGYPRAAAEMPVIYSVAVGLLSLAMVLDEVIFKRRRLAARQTASAAGSSGDTAPGDAAVLDTGDGDSAGAPAGKRWVAMAAIFALAVAYVLLLQTLGYILATALFMAFALGILGTVRWTFAVIGSAVLIAVICLVFIWFLGLPIPLLPVFA